MPGRSGERLEASVYDEDGFDRNHPWDDPRQAPSNYEVGLEPPHGAISHRDYADFYDYQSALAAQNNQDNYRAWEAAQHGPSVPATTSVWPSPSPVRPVTPPTRPAVPDSSPAPAVVQRTAGRGLLKVLIFAIAVFLACLIVRANVGLIEKVYGELTGTLSSESTRPAGPRSVPDDGTGANRHHDAGGSSGFGSEAKPASVVRRYYADVNRRDYDAAWAVGGHSLSPNRTRFAAGYRDTAHDDLTIVRTSGDVVTVNLTATHTDGTEYTYTGWYCVQNGQITSGKLRQLN